MIDKKELEKQLADAGLISFETMEMVDLEKMVCLGENEISEIIRFTNANKIPSVFYCYRFYDEEDYQITDSMIDEDLCEDSAKALKIMRKRINDYNKTTEGIDYSRPKALFVYCFSQGYQVGIFELDFWLEEMNVLTAEDELEEIESTCEDELQEIQEEEFNKRLMLQETMKEQIMADKQFYLCTNKQLRTKYISDMFQKQPEYKKAFKGWREPTDFIELLWREFKANGS